MARPLKKTSPNLKKLAMMIYRRVHHNHEGTKEAKQILDHLLAANKLLDELQARDVPNKATRLVTPVLGREKRKVARQVDNPAKKRLAANQESRTAKAAGEA